MKRLGFRVPPRAPQSLQDYVAERQRRADRWRGLGQALAWATAGAALGLGVGWLTTGLIYPGVFR